MQETHVLTLSYNMLSCIFLWTRVWESEQEIQLRRNRNPHHPAQETDGLDEACEAWCVQVEANPAPFVGSRVWLHIPFIYPSYTLLITLALFFSFKWWDKIVQCLTAAGYSGVMPGYSPGGVSLSLDKGALCREIAWRLAKDPKVGHVVVSLRLFGLGSSIVEGGGRVVGKPIMDVMCGLCHYPFWPSNVKLSQVLSPSKYSGHVRAISDIMTFQWQVTPEPKNLEEQSHSEWLFLPRPTFSGSLHFVGLNSQRTNPTQLVTQVYKPLSSERISLRNWLVTFHNPG